MSVRYHARWVCPITAPPIANGTLVEEGGRIAWVGSREVAPAAERDVDLGDAILLPGLVNAHCHLELTAMRGFLEGVEFRDWLLRLTRARYAVLTPDMLLDAARLGVDEGLGAGITTFADTGDSGAGFEAMLERGVRGICYREVFGPDPSQAPGAIDELRDRVLGMRARVTPLVQVGISPHAPYTISDDLFRAAAALARDERLPMAIHVAESELETALVTQGGGRFAEGLRARGIATPVRARSPVALLSALGVLERQPLLIHCVRVDDADIADIATHDCPVAHCPASNARLGHGIAPLAALRRAGVRVGLGSDSVASNNRMDVLDESRLALLFAAARERSASVLSPREALALATMGGASALGLAGEIGSLEPGKAADLAAFALSPLRAPSQDPESAAVLALAGAPAAFVAVAGQVRVADGRLLRADAGVAARVQRTADLLAAWLASPAGDAAATSSAPTPGR